MTKSETPLSNESDENNGFPIAGDGFFGRPLALDPHTWPSAWHRAHDWYHYGAGYKDAAELLVAQRKKEGRGAKKLGPPIVFLYRQHLELSLKQLAHDCLRILGRSEARDLLHHRLDELWGYCVSLLAELLEGIAAADEVQQTQRVLKEFCCIDPKSMAFRYPEDKDGNPSLSRIGEVDLDSVRALFGKISNLIECIHYELHAREYRC